MRNILFIHGADNACFKPESTARTLERLAGVNGRQLYERHVIPGYGHIDCIYGKNAARDINPLNAAHIAAYNKEVAAYNACLKMPV